MSCVCWSREEDDEDDGEGISGKAAVGRDGRPFFVSPDGCTGCATVKQCFTILVRFTTIRIDDHILEKIETKHGVTFGEAEAAVLSRSSPSSFARSSRSPSTCSRTHS